MDAAQLQARIDAVTWYHEFDFGNGLKAHSNTPDAAYHRYIWAFIQDQLDHVDFRGKTVLDIGCWDGYWSFYAERRGAKSVLATDDCSQNWASSQGLLLAKELYGSSVEINQNLSAYELTSLNRKFDIILFLGVYYHLFDPFYAFAQIRHCCHPGTVVLVEGNEALALRPNEVLFNYSNHLSETLMTVEAVEQLLHANYFTIAARAQQPFPDFALPPRTPAPPAPEVTERLGWRWRLRMCAATLQGSPAKIWETVNQIPPASPPPPPPPPPLPTLLNRRVFFRCAPFEGVREMHVYRPPFGLDRYDPRFRTPAAVAA